MNTTSYLQSHQHKNENISSNLFLIKQILFGKGEKNS